MKKITAPWSAILLLFVSLLACSLTVSAAIPAAERQALIALYTSTGGDSWTDSSSWKTPPLDVDGFAMPETEGSWFGITVSADQVTSVSLTSNNLSGTIPAELGNLSNLQYLYLNGNQLTDSIPTELGSLSSLQSLILSGNQLSGSIPTQLGSLSGLTYLDLAYNQLTGTIPTQLGSMSSLQQLYLSENQLSGSIPTELGNLSNLTNLNLGDNQLTGSIPTELGSLADLQFISLENNQFSGSIPAALGSLTNLNTLRLRNNQLSGAIPTELGGLSALTILDVSYNLLTGSIPAQLGNLASLEELYLRQNQLTGSIPVELGSLSNLRRLTTSHNLLTGTIPTELGGLTALETLGVSGNQLSGTIPSSLANLVHLNENSGYTDIGYNALYSYDPALISFLNDKDPDWASTQTVAPQNVQATTMSGTSIMVSWVPIAYSGDPGGYRIFYSVTSGGPYTFFAQTTDKNVTQQLVTGLVLGGTYYFVVQARTEPHGNNQNTVDSENSNQASAIASGQLAVSGTVTLNGAPLAGVSMAGLPGDPVTDGSGNYGVMVEPWWSGTVTPALAGFAFTPASRSYVNIAADQLGQNFTAGEGNTEPNDDPASAFGLPMGTTDGLIFVAGDLDCYKFFVPEEAAGQDLKVNVHVTSPYPDPIPSGWRSDLDFELLDATQRVLGIAISAGDNETLYLHDVASGWYHVCVNYCETEYADSSGYARYAVTLETGTGFGLGFVSGRVVDNGGAGIQDVFLFLDPVTTDWNPSRPYMTTGPDGYYTIAFTPGTYTLQFTGGGAPGCISLFHTPVNVVGEYYNDTKKYADAAQLTFATGQTLTLEDAVLETGAVVEGQVIDLLGNPLANVWVRWYDLEGNTVSNERCLTDVNGDYSFGGGPMGGAKLRFNRSGYATEYYDNQPTFGTADVLPTAAGGTLSGYDAQLGAGGIISGIVSDGLGAGIAGVRVWLYSTLDETFNYVNGLSGSGGGYAFRVLPGDYKVYFDATGLAYTSEWHSNAGSFATATAVSVAEGESVNGIDAQLVSKPAISGNIELAGYPLAGVVMSGLPGDPVTDADGNYSALVDYDWSGTVTPTLNGFVFTPADRTYANTVVDQAGQNYTASESLTEPNDDPASAYELPLGATGDLIFIANETDCYKFFVPVEAAGQDLRVNVRVTSPYPDPIPPGWGSDLDFQLLDGTGRNLGITVSSSDNETIYLHDVASGWYYVYVGYSTTEYADAVNFARYTVTLETGTGFGLGYIRGRVVDGGGTGIENVFLYLDPHPSDWGISRPYMTTGADGDFTIAVTPGNYTFLFTNGGTRTPFHVPPNVVFEYYDNTKRYADAEQISLSGGQTLALGDINLETGAIVTGHVTNLSGTALANAAVLGYDLEGNTFSTEAAWTDSGGDYTINGVPTGGAKLRFSRNGYAAEFYDNEPSLGSAYTLPTVAGGTIVGVNAQLGAGGVVSGTVRDGLGAGIGNVKVWLYSALDGTFARGNVLTGDGGGYAFRLFPGDYKIFFDTTGLGYAPQWYGGAATFAAAAVVNVPDGGTASGIDAVLLPAAITVTSPVSGDRWVVGSVHAVTWDGRGAVGDVRIEYSSDDGASWIEIAAATANDGSCDWTLPQEASPACLVRVSETDGDPAGASGSFSIEPWLPGEGMQYNMIVHGTAYDGDGPAAVNDWIGAFGPGGANDCRAAARIGAGGSYYLTVRSDETNAETITFMLWPQAAGAGIASLETVEFVADEVYGGLPLHFGPRTQALALVGGWNWVSWNVLPADTSLAGMFTPLLGTIEQVKSQTQAAVYSGGAWIGDLADMSGIGAGLMYKVKTSQAGSLSLTAPGIPFYTPIATVAGWNWLAYLPAQPQPLAGAVASIFAAVTQVKSQTQSAVKVGGALTGDLEEMEPGLGYTVKVTDPGILVYPHGQGFESGGAQAKKSEAGGAPTWAAITGNQYNMVAYGKAYFDGVPLTREGCSVGTFGPRGTADCRSISPVDASGGYFATVRGDTIGEAIRFILYDSGSGKSYESGESVPFVIDGLHAGLDLHFSQTAPSTISGTVTCAGAPLAGVTMGGLAGDPQTDAAGFYSSTVAIGWSGTVTPAKAGFAFTPASTTYADIAASRTTDYAASTLSPLAVTSPNGNESWAPGSTHDITWIQDGLAGNVTLELYRNGVRRSALGTPAASSGAFSWAIPAGLKPGNDYKVRVSQGAIEDFSDGAFSIAAAPADFNADGLSDILWRYYGLGGKNQIWLIGEAASPAWPEEDAITAGIEAEAETGAPEAEEAVSDEEMAGGNAAAAADPHQAIDLAGGDLNAALASGPLPAEVKSGLAVLRTLRLASRASTEWRIAGTGDFNNDGKADIIWRHGKLGKNQLWLMDGAALKAVVNLPGQANPKWRIAGAGDFNLDGHVDILWRYYGDGGYNSVWLMKGVKKAAVASLPAMADTLWEAVGCGDFNLDRKPDIVWRYQGAGGANAVWLMDGTTLGEQQALPAESDPMWRIGGVGDCNGDGKADLLWRYDGPGGADIVWLMDGLGLLSQELLPARTNLKWKIENH